jgi:hypothetical protein
MILRNRSISHLLLIQVYSCKSCLTNIPKRFLETQKFCQNNPTVIVINQPINFQTSKVDQRNHQ